MSENDFVMFIAGEAVSRLVRWLVRRPEELSHPPAEGRRRGVLRQVRGLPAESAPGEEEGLLRARSARKEIKLDVIRPFKHGN